MEVLGIRPSLYYIENACEAITKLTGPEESACFVAIWRDGQNVGVLLTELSSDHIFTAVAQPITANTLVTYHLSYAQPHQFQIVREDDSIRGLISEQNSMIQKMSC